VLLLSNNKGSLMKARPKKY